MKFKKVISIVICFIMVVCFSACESAKTTSSTSANIPTGDKNPLLTEARWEGNDGNCLNRIIFGNDSYFGNSCACGEPVGDADLTELYRYDNKDKTIELYDCDGGLVETANILYLDKTYLVINVWDKVYTYANQKGNVPTVHNELIQKQETTKTLSALSVLDYKNNKITVSSHDYDADAKNNYDVWHLDVAEDIGFSSIMVLQENGRTTIAQEEIPLKDSDFIGVYYTYGYFEFNTKGEVSHITFYGEILNQ